MTQEISVCRDDSGEMVTLSPVDIRLKPRENTDQYFERLRPNLMEAVIARFLSGDKICTDAVCKILTAPYLQKAKMTAIDAKTGKAMSLEGEMSSLLDLVKGKTKADQVFSDVG